MYTVRTYSDRLWGDRMDFSFMTNVNVQDECRYHMFYTFNCNRTPLRIKQYYSWDDSEECARLVHTGERYYRTVLTMLRRRFYASRALSAPPSADYAMDGFSFLNSLARRNVPVSRKTVHLFFALRSLKNRKVSVNDLIDFTALIPSVEQLDKLDQDGIMGREQEILTDDFVADGYLTADQFDSTTKQRILYAWLDIRYALLCNLLINCLSTNRRLRDDSGRDFFQYELKLFRLLFLR